MSYYATGVNTVHGADSGPAPPGFYPGGTGQHPSSAYYPGMPPPGQLYGYPGQPQYASYPGMAFPGSANPPDHGFPGVHLQNHTGRVGLPPGYNYIFPQEHTIIHVFKTTTKPWQATILANDTRTHVKLYVAVRTTTKELLASLGCRNPDASKNIMYECVEKGNGQWASGMKFKGDDKDRMKKAISEWGWDSSRVGGYGQNPVVWLWCTSEGA